VRYTEIPLEIDAVKAAEILAPGGAALAYKNYWCGTLIAALGTADAEILIYLGDRPPPALSNLLQFASLVVHVLTSAARSYSLPSSSLRS
jgi:hypothetical protein